jgi:hypothetical protein
MYIDGRNIVRFGDVGTIYSSLSPDQVPPDVFHIVSIKQDNNRGYGAIVLIYRES